MALEITGSLITKLQIQSGNSTRGEWQKQEFVIETQETYPRKVCMNVWGADKVAELASFREGDLLKISFNIESREYNQRWYTDIRAWRIEKADKDGSNTGEREYRGNQGAQASASGSPSLQSDIPSDPGEDDLPF